MTGSDFLPLANQLAAAATEPEWRTAISRAYYAAFHVARQLLEELGFRVPWADRAHAYLTIALKQLRSCPDTTRGLEPAQFAKSPQSGGLRFTASHPSVGRRRPGSDFAANHSGTNSTALC